MLLVLVGQPHRIITKYLVQKELPIKYTFYLGLWKCMGIYPMKQNFLHYKDSGITSNIYKHYVAAVGNIALDQALGI